MHLHRIATLLLVAAAPGKGADQVSFGTDSVLLGKVTAIEATGAVTLDAAVSAAPVLVLGDALRRVDFSREGQPESHDSLVRLRNGDTLPCEVTAMDERGISVTTWFAGSHTLPRDAIGSIAFGVRPQRLIFSGPEGLEDWTDNNGWRFSDGAFVADERASIRCNLDLPESFILRVRLGWEGVPDIALRFAGSTAADTETDDFYQLSVNAEGVQLKRPRPDDGWAAPLYVSGPRPEMIAAGEAEFELRIDRRQREFHFYIDGRQVKRGFDTAGENSPTGTDLTVVCAATHEGAQRLSLVEVYEWDSVTQRHQAEGPGDGPGDSVIDREGQRFSGNLRGISGTGAGAHLILETPHSEGGPMSIPLSRLSTIYFAGAADDPPPAHVGPALHLRPRGFLRLRESRFEEDRLLCRHPVIGEMRIERRALDSLTPSTAAPATPDQP